MQKPYRFLVDRVTSYAEEAGAFARRRRLRARPFVRVWRGAGSIESLDPAAGGAAIATAAVRAIELTQDPG